MKPEKMEFYVYTESDDEAESLREALHDFVNWHRSRGTAVRASKVTRAIRSFGHSAAVEMYLRQ